MSTNMIGIAWNDSYSIGCEDVDLQHKQLIAHLNSAVTACADGQNTDHVRSTVAFLVNYTVKHFADEEAIQKKCGFPGYEAHKKLHDDLTATVGEVVKKFETDGSTTDLSNTLNTVLIKWVINHIHNEDKKIGEFIRSQNQ